VPKGWTVEVTTQQPDRWGHGIVSHQLFDVAIEDRNAAIAAVRQHAEANAMVQILQQRPKLTGFSPGRIRPRSQRLVTANRY
jgi:hypothetical protein